MIMPSIEFGITSWILREIWFFLNFSFITLSKVNANIFSLVFLQDNMKALAEWNTENEKWIELEQHFKYLERILEV